jgi:hypothetical protein
MNQEEPESHDVIHFVMSVTEPIVTTILTVDMRTKADRLSPQSFGISIFKDIPTSWGLAIQGEKIDKPSKLLNIGRSLIYINVYFSFRTAMRHAWQSFRTELLCYSEV